MNENDAKVEKGVPMEFVDLPSAAPFMPLRIMGGAAGVTEIFSISKAEMDKSNEIPPINNS